jgi:hypothetical protein
LQFSGVINIHAMQLQNINFSLKKNKSHRLPALAVLEGP